MTDDDLTRESMLRSMTDSEGRSARRRGVLGGVVAGVTAALGLSSPASADTGRTRSVGTLAHVEMRQRYGSADVFESVFAEHEEMLATLADRGMLDASSAADLEIRPGELRDGARETVKAVEESHGGVTAELRVTRELGDGRILTMGVRPERGVRWAIVGDGDDTGSPVEDVTTMACCDCCTLEQECCEYGCGPYSCGCEEYCWTCACPDGCC